MTKRGIEISLACCTQVILNEIAQGLSQKQVASTYALAIASEFRGQDRPDWSAINGAIVARWSERGLTRIKQLAWTIIAEGRAAP